MMATEVHMHGRIGESIKRKEDGPFLRGKGNYLDDIELPGMLHMAILRSPHAHARIKSVDTAEASKMPGVLAVVTGELMAQHKLAWMPTLSYDTQAVLATDKVRFQGQEVAAVIAETRYQAEDARDTIIVDYEVLTAVTSPEGAKNAGAPLIRDDKENQKDNHIYHWESGDQGTTQAAFAKADKVVRLHTFYPRCHPAPLETCGCVADVNGVTGKATIYMTSQAPHAIRTVFALVTGLPEQNIRVVSPDIGGGFGNKVPVYPGYVVATAASLLIGRPVKWIEDRTENLISTGYARDFHMTGDLALDKDGKITALRVHLDSDNGAFFADAQPSKFKAGLFHIVTGSYDIPTAHITADGYYTNKAPGGVAYRCSFRVTEASYLIERLITNAAIEIGMDQAEFRKKNFIRKDQFPYHSATGWVYDSGDYHKAMDVALDQLGYGELRKDVEKRRQQGEVTGIGIASFTEVVGAGPGADFDILACACSTARNCASTRPARPSCAWARSRKARATKRHSPRSWPRSSASPPRMWRWRRATPTPRRTAWALTRRAARRSPARRLRWFRASCARKVARSRPTCSRRPRRTSSGSADASSSRVHPTRPRRSRRSPSPHIPTCPKAWRPGWRACTTTTRRT